MEKYFTGLNYSLANEDNSIERALIENSQQALAVCGSGTRALSLLQPGLQELTIIDISQAQLDYARFKFELIRTMSYDDYLLFIGLCDASPSERVFIFKKYQHSDWTFQYYQQIPKDIIAKGIVYSGKWESFLILLGKIITFLTGYEKFNNDFESNDHAILFWPEKRLKFLIGLLAHPKLLNRLLYRGQMIDLKDQHLGNFLLNAFKKSFTEKDPRSSFFLQMLFLGKISYPQAYPLEFQRPIFNDIKNFRGKINFLRTDLVSAIENVKFEFASISNVASYFDLENKKKFEKILLRILNEKPKKIILRSFLRPDPVLLSDLQVYLDQEAALTAEQQDKTLLYRFQIFKNL